jgi:OOP family OmpA-OmpF porin
MQYMGRRVGRFLFLMFALQLLLPGCWRFGVDELRNIEPNGTAFQNALSGFYLKFSESEAKQYDWRSAEYFAQKGIKSANGEEVLPENPKDWDVPETMTAPIIKAREILLKAVDPRSKNIEPETSALAYFLFDCWVEQQEEDWQTEHIESCRGEFFEVIDYLSVVVDNSANDNINLDIDPSTFEVVERVGTTSVLKKTIDTKAMLAEALPTESPTKQKEILQSEEIEKTSHVIFFEFDSAEINKGGLNVVKEVIKELSSVPEYLIKLNGYADRAGNEEYNLNLSKLRAMAVKSELVNRGVVEDSIEMHSFGETRPRKATKDDVREKSNRIVEIFIH